jgi:hypothetical protein
MNTTRYAVACKRCKTHATIEAANGQIGATVIDALRSRFPAFELGKSGAAQLTMYGTWYMRNALDAKCCGRDLAVEKIAGRVSVDHKCDARCVQSKGHTCECSCGGKNHGAGYAA